MILADRLRQLRLQKKFTQGDIEKRSGLLRCYVSRVENGYTVPSFQTLEKFASALEVPMYAIFYDGEEPLKPPSRSKRKQLGNKLWGDSGNDARMLEELCQIFSRMDEKKLNLLYSVARTMAKSKGSESR
jgi:transcriptional regulator with XRE-family HTH domain